MDERKKQIEERENQKQENLAALDAVLERLGETLFGRLEQTPSLDIAEFAAYRQLQGEIAECETAIRSVEEQIRRFRDIEEAIETKEREDLKQVKELAGVYAKIGSLILNDSGDAYRIFTSPWREQADALAVKVRSLEIRINELDQRAGNNVFVWIGKSAQGLVLRSFLTKAQENLGEMYRSMGERYCRRDPAECTESPGEELEALLKEVETVRHVSLRLSDELLKFREEKRLISESFGVEGSPLKQIQHLKNQISRIRNELTALYRRFGAEAVSLCGAEKRPLLDSLLSEDDAQAVESAGRLDAQIREDEEAVARLRAAMAIDEETEKIEKYRRQIVDRKARIAEAERDIAGLEEDIRDSEKYIEELQKLA